MVRISWKQILSLIVPQNYKSCTSKESIKGNLKAIHWNQIHAEIAEKISKKIVLIESYFFGLFAISSLLLPSGSGI